MLRDSNEPNKGKTPANSVPPSDQNTQELEVLADLVAERAIELGCDSKDLAKLVEIAFVRSAIKRYTRSGRKPNRSQIAAQTGLTRSEVRVYLEMLTDKASTVLPARRSKIFAIHQRITREIPSAQRRRQFVDIPYEGKGRTFANVVKEIGGDIPPAALLKEFVRRGLVRTLAAGPAGTKTIRILTKFYVAPINRRPSIELGLALKDLATEKDSNDSAGSLSVAYQTVNDLEARQLILRLKAKAPVFLESLDPLLGSAAGRSNKKGVRSKVKIAVAYWRD
jgi:hypothetical protein